MPDFTGYATKYNVKCSDGRTIRKNAFSDCNGKRVPLVWEHGHDSPDNVVGYADLFHRDDGVYVEGSFNDSEKGQVSKKIVAHGDVNCLSICANHIMEKDKNVMHGNIKEVSLVLSGANPKAVIDNVIIEHSDGSFEKLDECIMISTPEMTNLNGDEHKEDIAHSDENQNGSEDKKEKEEKEKEEKGMDNNKTVKDIYDTMSEDQKNVMLYLVALASSGVDPDDIKQSDDDHEFNHADDDLNVGAIWNTFTEEQKNITLYLMTKAIEEADKKSIKQSDESEDDYMKFNAFEKQNEEREVELTHSDINDMIQTAINEKSSLKDSMLMHSDEYGVTDIGFLFPDSELVDKKIELIRNNPTDWVAKVIGGVHKSPFSRIKMLHSDITADTARAKGYIKGTQKISEVIPLAKRVISPTTIYKLQKLDRDDIIDVTTIDVVAWIKAEMRIMIEEEIARAILLGDQRDPSESYAGGDKIDEECVIPIIHDYKQDFYAVRHNYTIGDDENEYVKFVDEVALGMVDYQGSGSPTLFAEPSYIAHCLLIKDAIGNRIYKNRDELASAMGVKEIIEVPYMKNTEYEDADHSTQNTMYIPTADSTQMNPKFMQVRGIVVNLNDYVYGADKGGALNMFDDFDIDFNQYKYLIETRASGALRKFHSAILVGTDVVSG